LNIQARDLERTAIRARDNSSDSSPQRGAHTPQNPAGVTTYTSDADGNRTQQNAPASVTYYSWDEDDRLIEAEPVAGVVAFTYNADGQRMVKTAPASTTRFIYDFQRLLEETDGSGATENQYTYVNNGFGDLVSEYDTPNTTYHAYDAQHSTDSLLDDSGSTIDVYKYKAFGLAQAQIGVSQTPFTYVGQQGYYQDAELELYYLGMGGGPTAGRAYDPSTGRFLTPDPTGFTAGDANLYRCVGNNPVGLTDPTGQWPWSSDSNLLDMSPPTPEQEQRSRENEARLRAVARGEIQPAPRHFELPALAPPEEQTFAFGPTPTVEAPRSYGPTIKRADDLTAFERTYMGLWAGLAQSGQWVSYLGFRQLGLGLDWELRDRNLQAVYRQLGVDPTATRAVSGAGVGLGAAAIVGPAGARQFLYGSMAGGGYDLAHQGLGNVSDWRRGERLRGIDFSSTGSNALAGGMLGPAASRFRPLAYGVSGLGVAGGAAEIYHGDVEQGSLDVLAGGVGFRYLRNSRRATLSENAYPEGLQVSATRPPAPVGESSPLAPGGGLAAHEGGAWGGHTLSRHVGLTEELLQRRLAAQPGISASSSFTNRAVAESAVDSTIKANAALVADWLKTTPGRFPRLTLKWNAGSDSTLGITVPRGSPFALPASGNRVILIRSAASPVGYRVLTAYPE